MIAFIRRHPVPSYFTLAFALSWTGVMAVISSGPIPAPPAEAERLFPFVYLAMLIGPPAAGLSMTALASGRSGLRDYFGRLTKWRVAARWYVVALFTAPVVLTVTLFALTPWSRDFLPGFLVSDSRGPIQAEGIGSFLTLALLVGIGAGFFEELGWTGFAIPTMRSRFGVEATGLIVGLLWGAWHFLAIFWGSAQAFGSASVSVFMVVALFSFLPPYRILMARVYDSTRSLFLAVLMHASLTTSMFVFSPPATGNGAIVYDLVFGGALWIVVAGTSRHVRVPRLAEATP
jgi:membrane protease YdiL (CAAX protease family)